MSHKVFSQLLLYGSLALLLAAVGCNMPTEGGSGTPSAPTDTPLGLGTASSTATATPTPTATRTPTDTSTGTATDTATPEPTATATIAHVVTPGAPPAAWLSEIIDHDSSITASQHRTTAGENFAADLYERPFNAETMDTYFPDLDIKRARLSMDATWVYVTLKLVGVSPDGDLTGNYGVEVDLNLDGRGDVLVLASAPQDAWSTDGVWAWKDKDHDVGSSHPLLTDPPPTAGDGYETLVFDQGHVPEGILEADPDSAWARLAPDDPASVQLAFKKALISNDGSFLWGGWADLGVFEPGWYDYNDHFTHAEAGSPLVELSSFYPLKALFEVDNTCRWSVGFVPAGSEPGLCPMGGTQLGTATRTSTPTRTNTPGGPSLTPSRTPTRSNTPFQPNATPTPTRSPTRTNTPLSGATNSPTRTPTPTLNCAAAASNVCTPTPTRSPTRSPTPAGVPGGPNGR